MFYLKPYSLDLTFSSELESTPEAKATYDIDKQLLLCKLPKKNKGEDFKDLDMITNLFRKRVAEEFPPKKEGKMPPIIEVISSTENLSLEEEKKPPTETLGEPMILVSGPPRYGFNWQYAQVFENLQEELHDIADLDVERIEAKDRFLMKKEKEQIEFDYDRYICDTFMTEEIEEVISLPLPKCEDSLSKEELIVLKNLPNKEYLIQCERGLFFQIIDILFAYHYDRRTTGFAPTSESHWTINKLSATLSCFCDFRELETEPLLSALRIILVSSFRRVLIYPLYRNYSLAEKIQQDLALQFTKPQVIKALIAIRRIFEHSEPKYLLNKIFIDDFLIYFQQIPNEKFDEIKAALSNVKIEKIETELNLKEYEDMYHLTEN